LPFLGALREGASIRDACTRALVSRQTFYEQRRRDSVLADAVDYLRGKKPEPQGRDIPAWWLIAQGVPVRTHPRRSTGTSSGPDRRRRALRAAALRRRGLTLDQIGRLLAETEGLDRPLTPRQVGYAIRQADGEKLAREADDATRVARCAFDRANRDTATASYALYDALRCFDMSPRAAAGKVRSIVDRTEPDFSTLPPSVQDLAATVAERARYRDALHRQHRAAATLGSKRPDVPR
jgi:hypothetical protein